MYVSVIIVEEKFSAVCVSEIPIFSLNDNKNLNHQKAIFI